MTRLLTILLLACAGLYGTAFTSSQNGNWTSSSTWGGAGVPGSGDTCTIGHNVTVQVSDVLTVGNSTPGSDSVLLSSAGTLTLNGSLHVDGDFNFQGTITVGADSIFEFGNGGYTFASNTGFANLVNLLQSSGTSAAHPFTIRTVTGGTPAKTTINDHYANKVNLHYGTFLRMGSSSTKAYSFAYGGATTGAALHVATFDHVTFDTCGQVNWQDGAPIGAGWSFTNVTFVNTAAANPLLLNGAANPTNTRLVDGSYFDKPPSIQGNGATYTRNVFLNGWIKTSATADWARFGETSFADGNANFVRVSLGDGTGATLGGSLTGNYILVDSPNAPTTTGTATASSNSTNTGTLTDSGASWTASSGAGTGFSANQSNNAWMVVITGGTGAGQIRSIQSNTSTVLTVLYPWVTLPDNTSTYAIVKGFGNPHVLSAASVISSTVNLSYNVAEHTGADNNGDLFSTITAAGVTYAINYNIALPSGSGDDSFDIISPDASARPFSLQHNTMWAGAQANVTMNDGSNVPAGKMSSYKSNLVVSDPAMTSKYAVTGSGSWTASALGPYEIGDGINANNPANGNQDVVSPANVTNNGRWGLKNGFATVGYNINLSGTPDSGTGQSADPNFVDSTRNFAKWAFVRGYSSSVSPLQRVADGLAALKADPTRIVDLITYVRAGLAPRASAYNGTAHDGTTIGAIAAPPLPGLFPLPNSFVK